MTFLNRCRTMLSTASLSQKTIVQADQQIIQEDVIYQNFNAEAQSRPQHCSAFFALSNDDKVRQAIGNLEKLIRLAAKNKTLATSIFHDRQLLPGTQRPSDKPYTQDNVKNSSPGKKYPKTVKLHTESGKQLVFTGYGNNSKLLEDIANAAKHQKTNEVVK